MGLITGAIKAVIVVLFVFGLLGFAAFMYRMRRLQKRQTDELPVPPAIFQAGPPPVQSPFSPTGGSYGPGAQGQGYYCNGPPRQAVPANDPYGQYFHPATAGLKEEQPQGGGPKQTV